MARATKVRVDFSSILDLPRHARTASLARKAMACLMDEKDTGFLHAAFQVTTDEEAIAALSQINGVEASHVVIGTDCEPMDKTDGTSNAVSLIQFAIDTDKENLATAKLLKAGTKDLIRFGDWEEAAYLAVSGLFHLMGNRRRGMVKLLDKIAPHHVVARLHLGKCLVRGDAVRRNLDRGIALLRAVTEDENPVHAGYAHFLLGETLMVVPEMGHRAMRDFESAAYLGWEDASDYAGVLCLLGENGVKRDLARAARNFKYGMMKGNYACMSKYVVMVLRGDAPYDPNWRELLSKAAEERESLALTVAEEVDAAMTLADGDEEAFWAETRARINGNVAMHVEVQYPEIRYEEATS